MELYIALFLGIAFLIVKRLNSATANPGFTVDTFIKKNLFSAIGNIVAGIILIMSGYVTKYITTVEMQFLVAASFGMTGMTFLQAIFDMFDKDKKTKVGINK